jgi:hypothetical protein
LTKWLAQWLSGLQAESLAEWQVYWLAEWQAESLALVCLFGRMRGRIVAMDNSNFERAAATAWHNALFLLSVTVIICA